MKNYTNCGYVRKSAFSLAEMMIVMLILSIILAAFAPIMTTRNKEKSNGGSTSDIWQRASNNSDIYYGRSGGTETVMIGQQTANTDVGTKARLVINNGTDEQSHILFKKGSDIVGRLFLDKNKNVGLGLDTLLSNTIGSYNNAFGSNALLANTTGSSNCAFGYQALSTSSTGAYNNAFGAKALLSNPGGLNGSYNNAFGFEALRDNLNMYNSAFGHQALAGAKGQGNSAFGYQALVKNTNDNYNNAFGYQALMNNDGGSGNNAFGYNALGSNTNGRYNIAFGDSALKANTTGSNNTAVGDAALDGNITGESNTAVGGSTMRLNGGSYNTAVGYLSMNQSTGSNNNAFGAFTLPFNTGTYNNVFGYNAMYTNKAGSGNNAFGYSALYRNSGGNYNNAFGYTSLYNNTTGSYDIAVGVSALYNNATGSYNTAVGVSAMSANAAGSNNSALGYQACQNVTGSNKTCIGVSSGPIFGHKYAGSTENGERIFIGSTSKYISSGVAVLEVHNVSASESGVVVNGPLIVRGPIISYRSSSTSDYWQGLSGAYDPYNGSAAIWLPTSHVLTSDARLKNIGKPNVYGLDEINKLKIFNYTLKSDKNKTPLVGVIAQDLQKVLPNAVLKNENGYLGIRIEDILFTLVNAVKELDAKITNMAKQILEIAQQVRNDKEILKQVQDDNKAKDAKIKSLEARLTKLEKLIK